MELKQKLLPTLLIWMYLMYSCEASPETFLSQIKQGPADLVILMDRSTAMGRYHFYTNQKALVHDIIMYHIPVFPDQVRIAIVTFATDADVIVDGISLDPITKCDLFKENGYWDKVLYKLQYIESNGQYTLNHTLTDGTYVDLAYSMAEAILIAGRHRRGGKRQYVLIATDAGWGANRDPRENRDKLLRSRVEIYIIGTGPWVGNRIGNLNSLQTDANRNNVQLDHTWKNAVAREKKLIEVVTRSEWVGSRDTVCFHDVRECEAVTGTSRCTEEDIDIPDGCTEVFCQNGGSCYEQTGVGFQCLCNRGYYGRYCEKNYDECILPNICHPGVTCQDGVNGFNCDCDGKCDETYCDCVDVDSFSVSKPNDNEERIVLSKWWVYVALPVVIYVLIVSMATAYACYRVRNPVNKQMRMIRLTKPETRSSSVDTAATMTTTAGCQTYSVPPTVGSTPPASLPHLTGTAATLARTNHNQYEAPKSVTSHLSEPNGEPPQTIRDKLRSLIATSTVPALIRNNTRRLSRLFPTRKAPEPPPGVEALNPAVSPKAAVYGSTNSVAQEIQATIAGRRYQKRHSTANHVITADVAKVVSRPVLPPSTWSKSFSSQMKPNVAPPRPPVLPQVDGTSKLRSPIKPLTPPADNTIAPKPVVPVKPVVTPRKPPVVPKPPPAIYTNDAESNADDIKEDRTNVTSLGKRIYAKPEGVESSEDDNEGEEDWYGTVWSDSEFSFGSNQTEPMAPTERPDISLENFQRKGHPIGSNYDTAPQCQGMSGWLDFVCDLTSKEGKNLDRVCIIQIDGKRWIASDGSLRPENNSQIGDIYRLLHSKRADGAEFVVGNETKRTFYIEKNDGLLLQAIGGKDGKKDEILCIGKSRKYLILGGIALSKDCGQCAIEIDYVRAHLKNMGD